MKTKKVDIGEEKWTLKVDIGAEKWTLERYPMKKALKEALRFLLGVAACMILTTGIRIALDGCDFGNSAGVAIRQKIL